jgi:transcriptional regulator with XRE-family HTH domain
MSAEKLARAAGVAKSHVSMLEAGRCRPCMAVIQSLATVLALNEEDHRLFIERAQFASRVSKCKPRKATEADRWRDNMLKTLLPPESPVEKMILNSFRAKANVSSFTTDH